jgi:hypothetical protein
MVAHRDNSSTDSRVTSSGGDREVKFVSVQRAWLDVAIGHGGEDLVGKLAR